MSDPVVEIVDLDTLVAQVMPDVVDEVPTVAYELSTRALPEHAAPPRIVWVPSRDRWEMEAAAEAAADAALEMPT